MNKRILICIDCEPLADAVSKWLGNRDCETATLVGKASEVAGKVEKKVREFEPEVLVTSYLNPRNAHEAVIVEARKANRDIPTYVFSGHPDVASDKNYKVFDDIYAILKEIGVVEAA